MMQIEGKNPHAIRVMLARLGAAAEAAAEVAILFGRIDHAEHSQTVETIRTGLDQDTDVAFEVMDQACEELERHWETGDQEAMIRELPTIEAAASVVADEATRDIFKGL